MLFLHNILLLGTIQGFIISCLLLFTGPRQMHLNIPLIYYRNAVDEPKEKGRGTMPDYPVSYTFQDVLTGVDTQLEYVYKLIEGKK